LAGTIGYQAKLQINDGASSAFVDVADCMNFTLPKYVVDKVDVTTLGQSSRVKSYIPGMVEPNQISVDAFWTPTSYSRVAGLRGVSKSFKATMQDTSTTYTFTGYIDDVGECEVKFDSAVSHKFTIQVTSDITIA
jgi:hypothetical protein